MQNVDRLIEADLFGTTAEVARIAGIDKAAVVRWRQGRHPVKPVYQERILKAARERNLPLAKVARALGVPQCPHCKHFHIVHK